MKRRTIQKVLDRKISDWLSSIDDKNVMKVARDNAIVTGGAIASMLLNESVNDYDIYFKDEKSTEIVAAYYLNKFKDASNWKFDQPEAGRVRIIIKSSGVAGTNEHEEAEINAALKSSGNSSLIDNHSDEERYKCKFVTENAITLSDQIQLITRFVGEAEEIHKNYDFLHATSSYDVKSGKLSIPDGVLECLINKELRYVGSLYPFASIVRIRKFVQRGWSINAGQVLKMAMQLNDLDLHDPQVLRDQLTGVDLAYFKQVLNSIPDEKFTTAYICKVIDKIFG